jgi:hypothetical protein
VASKEPAANAAPEKKGSEKAESQAKRMIRKVVVAAGLRRGKMIPREPAGKLVPEGLTKSGRDASGGAKSIRKQAAEGAAPERLMMISKRVVARVAPETLKMISKIKRAGANKMITVASLGRGKMTSRMVPVGAPALPRNKTCPKARASRMVPETLAMKTKGESLASNKIRKAAVARPVPERMMTNKTVVARVVPETLVMKAKGASLTSKKIKVAAVTRLDPENPMMIKKAMAESKAAWAGASRT